MGTFPNNAPMLGMSGMSSPQGGTGLQGQQQFQDPNAWLATMLAQVAAGQGQQPSAAQPANQPAPMGAGSQVQPLSLPPDPLIAQMGSGQQQTAGAGGQGPAASQSMNNALMNAMFASKNTPAAQPQQQGGILSRLFGLFGG